MLLCHFVFVCRRAAGASWSLRTDTAQWAARYGHTTVIDNTTGAIYVIGGNGQTYPYYLADVWVSTDTGAEGFSAQGYW